MNDVTRYADMKDSGVEWIGKIPSHWTKVRLKAVLSNVSIKNHNDAEVLSLYRDLGVVPKDSRDDNHNVTSEDTSSYKFVKKGDLVINKMKAWQGSLAISEFEGIVSPAYYVCKIKLDNINKRFIHYLLRCQNMAQRFECLSSGMRIGQWDLNIDDFLCEYIFLPKREEQYSISFFLDDQCAKIDDIIAGARTSIEEYKKWKASVIYEAVTKGLDPHAEMKDSGVDIIGMIPKYWSIRRQRFLCQTMTGNQDTQDAECGGMYPFYVRSPIVERANSYTFEGESILMAGDGVGAGKVFHHATGKYAIHQRVYCFYNFVDILPRFYYYFMSSLFSVEIEKGSAKSTVPSVRMPMILNFNFCVPPKEDQRAIIVYLDTKCSEIDQLISEKETLIADLESYKKSLIYEVVTGKWKVV